uniref:Uncharacterized protein n=1 Tax=Romanomermis culicivorax TaxID=13658 RepID=A0A915ILU1_ROMCU
MIVAWTGTTRRYFRYAGSFCVGGCVFRRTVQTAAAAAAQSPVKLAVPHDWAVGSGRCVLLTSARGVGRGRLVLVVIRFTALIRLHQAAERIDVDQNSKFASTGHSVADDNHSAISFDSCFRRSGSASVDSRVDISDFSDDPKPECQHLKLKRKPTDLINRELCGHHESLDSRAKRYANFLIPDSNSVIAAAIDEEISCFLEKDG